MSLRPGDQLLHYRLVEKIGEGGMGVVWSAVDTSLDREVAIKVLAYDFAADPERLARFEREAKLLAALDHPNIASVFGVHESHGIRFLAMELVPGEDLALRLSRERLSVEEILDIAGQVASALETAHDRDIIHRDLKPANLRIRPDGVVKILDFGLARGGRAGPWPGDDPPGSTVLTSKTRPGVVLGTPSYMSPEQARGRPVDKRTDIWSVGCILFECLSGRRPFEGDTPTDVLANVVSAEPDLGAIGADCPSFLRILVSRCLRKDPNKRLRDAGEIRLAIEEFRSNPEAPAVRSASEGRSHRRALGLLPWGLTAGLAFALIYAVSGRNGDSHSPVATPAVSRWTIPVPEGSRIGPPVPGGRFDVSRLVALSPDGSRVVYTVQDEHEQAQLYLREMASGESQPIAGTEGARGPFFSPDGQWVGFVSDNTIQRVSLNGGSPQSVCAISTARRSPVSFDACWSPDGNNIVYATDDGLFRVAAAGGEIERLTEPDPESGEVSHLEPRFTLDGRGVLFTVTVTPASHLAYLSLETRAWDILVRNASQGMQIDADRLVFARANELLMVPFDAAHERVTGSPVSVLQGVQTLPGVGGAVVTHFDVSRTGTLAYVPQSSTETVDQLVWVDFDGNETLITQGPGTWVHPRLSPDGTRISVDIHSANGMRDVYIYEMDRGQLNRLTETGLTWESEWRPDGRRMAVLSGAPAGKWSLFWVRTDFSGAPELLHPSNHLIPTDWFPDGSALIYTEYVEGGIWKFSPESGEEPVELIGTAAWERFARLSPDARWIAYVRDDPREVFVQSFPDFGPKHKISIQGGGEPVWSHDGRRLFFREDDAMYAVDLEYEPTFRASRPRMLFQGRYDSADVGHQHYDISRDDTRFLMIKHGEAAGPSEVRIVLHWSQELDSK